MIHQRLIIISFLKHHSKWKTILNSWNTTKPLISADLEPQIISYQLNRVGGIILIAIIEYAFCVIVISEMNSIIFYSVNILNLVENSSSSSKNLPQIQIKIFKLISLSWTLPKPLTKFHINDFYTNSNFMQSRIKH